MIVPLLIGLLVFLVAARYLGRRRVHDPAKRIALLVEPRRTAAAAGGERAGVVRRAVDGSAPWLAKAPAWNRFASLLERGGVERAAADVAWTIWFALAGLGLLLVLMGTGLFLSALFVGTAAVGVVGWLNLRAARRRRAFEEHLPDVLAEIASALRAGHGFLQAMQAVAADAPPPVGPELQRVLAEARLGRPIDEALLAAGERVRSADFSFVLDAVVVQRQVGGSLASIFEVVGESVRSRHQFAMKVRALTAMGRLSAGVLVALPILVGLGLTALNSAYMTPLIDTNLGRVMLTGSVVLLGIGTLWLQRVAAGVD